MCFSNNCGCFSNFQTSSLLGYNAMRGPRGFTGPQGPVGPQGPAGVSSYAGFFNSSADSIAPETTIPLTEIALNSENIVFNATSNSMTLSAGTYVISVSGDVSFQTTVGEIGLGVYNITNSEFIALSETTALGATLGSKTALSKTFMLVLTESTQIDIRNAGQIAETIENLSVVIEEL